MVDRRVSYCEVVTIRVDRMIYPRQSDAGKVFTLMYVKLSYLIVNMIRCFSKLLASLVNRIHASQG